MISSTLNMSECYLLTGRKKLSFYSEIFDKSVNRSLEILARINFNCRVFANYCSQLEKYTREKCCLELSTSWKSVRLFTKQNGVDIKVSGK